MPETNTLSDKLLIADCPSCRKKVLAETRGEVLEAPDVDAGLDEPRRVNLMACTICGSAILVTREWVPGLDEWDDPENAWPNGASVVDAPHKIQRAFQETHRCFHQANAYSATATMARRTLELVCNDQGATGKTLAQKIQWLKQNNKIEGRLLQWATALRFVGNDGAHGDAVGRQDAEDALALTEALLEHIYVLTVQYEKFSERRRKRSQASAPAVPNPTTGAQGVTTPPTS
ncbi:DUF4145 domain-containing protein [Streptomyces rubiginosohelvolus]